MLRKLLRMLSRRHRARQRRLGQRTRRIRFEPLESRYLLAARFWDGGPSGTGTSWHDPLNWDGDTLPAPGDDVTINVAANPTITVANSVTINSLVTSEAITFSGGTFTANTLQVNGALASLSGAVLKGLTLSGTGTLDVTSADGTFDGLTLGVNTTLRDGAQVTVLNNLNMASGRNLRLERTSTAVNANSDATLDVGLNFAGGAQTLGGSGSVTLFHSVSTGSAPLDRNTRIQPTGAGASLTIAPGITVRNGPFSDQAVVGDSTLPLIIQGTVNAQSPGRTLRLRGSTVTTTGTLQASAGILDINNLTGNLSATSITNGVLDLDGNYTINQPVTIPAGTGGLTLGGNWLNASTITQIGGTINLGDTFTSSDLGLLDSPSRFVKSGGTVNLTGTLDNTGTTLPLTGAAGSWQLAGGAILGGVVTASGGARLIGTTTPSTLSGVTLNGNLDLAVSNAVVTIANGLVLNGTANLSAFSTDLRFSGSQTLSGSGTVLLGNDSAKARLSTSNSTLTIGAGITVRSGGTTGSLLLGHSDPFLTGISVVNYGTVVADVSGTTIFIQGAAFTNFGSLEAKNGGHLSLFSSSSIQSGTVIASGGTLSLNGDWTNLGSISNVGGTVNLGGTFSMEDLGLLATPSRFTRSGGTVNLTGTLDNPGTTLPLDAATGSWVLNGGTIVRGTVEASDGAKLVATSVTATISTLNGVTLNGDLDIGFGGRVQVVNGLTLNGAVRMERAGQLKFAGTQTLSGTGTVAFGQAAGGVVLTVGGTTLTIGPDITLRANIPTTGGGVGYNPGVGDGGSPNISVVNYGKISADGDRTAISVNGQTFINHGTMEAKNGGALNFNSLTTLQNGTVSVHSTPTVVDGITTNVSALSLFNDLTNAGSINMIDSTVNLRGSFTLADLGILDTPSRFTRSGGNVDLYGTLDNTGTTLPLNAVNGSWRLTGGTILGGTITTAGGSRLLSGSSGTLNGVTLNGDFEFANTLASVIIVNGLVLNGTASLNKQQTQILFSGTQTLSGTGTLLFGNVSRTNVWLSTVGTVLTIGPGITVGGGSSFSDGAELGKGPGTFAEADDSIINLGTIAADVTGTTIKVLGAALTNRGTVQAKNGRIDIRATDVTNQGTIIATGGNVDLNPAKLFPNGGVIEASGGNITVTPADTSNFLLNGLLSGIVWRTDLTGGTWRVGPNSVLRLLYNRDTTKAVELGNLAAAVELSGVASNFYGGATGSVVATYDAMRALSRINSQGNFTIRDGRNYTAIIPLTNLGQLRVEASSTLTLPATGMLVQASGVTTINGILTAPGGVTISGGQLGGVGDITANVINISGTVAPGNSPGNLDIFGNYTQAAGGTLLVKVAGRNRDLPQFDRLRVSGTATLDGTVRAELLGEFEPTPGDFFDVLSASIRVGRFATHDFPYPGGFGRQINPLYSGESTYPLLVPGLVLQTEVVSPLIFVAATTGGVADGTLAPEQVVFDLFGNSYVTGRFSGNVDFDREHPVPGDTIASTGNDGYLAAYDPAGQLLWVQSIDGSEGAFGAGIAIDHGNPVLVADDRIYVTGAFGGAATYAGQTVTGVTQDAFLLQTTSSGALGAFTALPSGSTAFGRRVAIATGGNPLIAGEFTGTLTSAAVTLTSAGSTDAFVMEYAIGSGVVRSARIGGLGDDRATDVAIGPAGEVWLAGDFTGSTTGLAPLTAAGVPLEARTDAFLLKLSPSGTGFAADVERSFGGNGNDTAAAVAVDPAGNVFLGGSFEHSVDFDISTAKAFTLHSGGDHDVFVVKLAAGGDFQWARAVGGYREDSLTDLTTDAAGHVYTTGEFRDRVDFDPQDGIQILATSSEATPEAFLSKLDAVGTFLWAVPLGDNLGAVSRGAGLDVSNAGRLVSVGQFENTVDFDPTELEQLRTFTPSVPGASAGYLSLLDQKAIPELTITGLPSGAVLEGTTLALASATVDPDSDRFDYNWTILRSGKPYAEGSSATLTALLVDQGVYTITLVVKDESGNRDTATATVIANNAPPVMAPLATSAASINENGSVTVSGSFSDPGVNDTHTIVIDWSDGSRIERIPLVAGKTTFSATHQYLDDDPTATPSDNMNIRVRVQDDTPDVLAAKAATGAFQRYDGTTLHDLGLFVAAGSGGLSMPAAVTVGPDGDIYASSGAAGANPVLRFDGLTGAFVETFISEASSGSTATDLTFGPDGNLYYVDGAGSRVLRFDGRTGAFLDVFVHSGSGGLADPRGVEFGPDGNLYIASFGSDSILRYSGQTGAFLASVVSSDELLDLAFGPDNELFVLTTQPTPAVLRFDAQTGESLGTLANFALSGASARLLFCGNNLLAVSDAGGPLLQFDTTSGTQSGAANSNDGALAGLPLQAQATVVVTVNNTPPKVNVVAVRNNTPGQYTLMAEVSDAGTLDTHTYSWAITGGTPSGAAVASTFSFTPTAVNVSVVLTVTDDDTGTISSRTQVIIGTAAADTITLNNASFVLNGVTTSYTSGTNRVVAFGLAGDDTISAAGMSTAGALPVELIGGDGNDALTGGAKDDLLLGNNPGDYVGGVCGDTGDDALIGNAGNDMLDAGCGNDRMEGGEGNDTYLEVPGSDDVLIEGGSGFGIDTIDYSLAFFGIQFSLTTTDTQQVVNPTAPLSSQHTVKIIGDFENLRGSQFSDQLTGNSFNNELLGGTGNDALIGGAGDDIIFGGDDADILLDDGDDSLDGGLGDDLLVGGSADDVLIGGDGDDVIFGGDDADILLDDGDDTLDGGAGDDTLDGGAGNDVLVGGSNDDVLIGNDGDDVIFGGDDADILLDDGEDTLDGGAGNDLLVGGSEDDVLIGGDGDDVIFGGDDTDILLDDGDDTLDGGAGDDTLDGGAGNDVLVGGSDDDVLIGDDGDDVIFGGDDTDILLDDGDDTLDGGAGEDTLDGGAGNDVLIGGSNDDVLIGDDGDDVIFGGDDTDILLDDGEDTLDGGLGDDLLVGGSDDDVLIGGDGDDVIFGGDDTDILLDDGDDTLDGGAGDDTLDGGAGNDVLVGGADDDVLIGDDGDDVIFGGPGDDELTGNAGLDVFEGGSGSDRLVESRDADMVLSPTQLTISGAPIEIHFDIELATLTGGPSNNEINASGFPGAVILLGLAGNDTLRGGPQGDALFGGTGNDSLFGNDGDDTLDGGAGDDTLDGGAGNDRYLQTPGSIDVLNDSQGIDSIDMGSASRGVNVDLGLNTSQTIDSAGNVLLLNGTFENFRGTSFNDMIKGNAKRNVLEGAGGIDVLEGGADADRIQGSFTQLVYLDFVSASGQGERIYSVEERNAIQLRLERIFAAPLSISFTQTPPSIGRFSTIIVNAGSREENEPLVGGIARELDWRNYNPASLAAVNVNEFLGRRGQPAASSANFIGLTTTIVAHELGHLLGLQHFDSFGPLGTGISAELIARSLSRGEVVTGTLLGPTQPNSIAYQLRRGPVALQPTIQAGNTTSNPFQPPSGTVFRGATAVASFVIDTSGIVRVTPLGDASPALVGGNLDPESATLKLNWLQLPVESSVVITYYYDAFRPGYRGPDDAHETSRHIMASPASVGSRIEDALFETYLSERELIKLAFADASTSVSEDALPSIPAPPVLAGSARNLGDLPSLAVANLLPSNAVNFGKQLQVEAINVVGSIELSGGISQNDIYSFTGSAGERVTVEVLSAALRHRFFDEIDAMVSIRSADGNLLDYYGQGAASDDGFDSQDPLLLDVVLPTDGTYFIVVDTFSSATVPDRDTGEYELFIYKYTVDLGPRQGGSGDTLVGDGGPDVLIGSAGDDRFIGELAEDQFLGFSEFDFLGPAVDPNDAPVANADSATVSEDNTNNVIDVLANDTDADNQSPTPANSGLTVTAVGSASHGTASLVAGVVQYSPAANYYGPDGFTYTVSDGNGLTSMSTVNIMVTNVEDAQVANPDSATVSEDSTSNVIDVLANDSDADNQSPTPANAGLTVTAVGLASHGTVILVGGVVQYTPTANYYGPGSFTYTVIDATGLTSTATVNVTVTNAPDAAVVNADSATVSEDSTNNVIDVLANDSDADNQSPTPANTGLTVTAVETASHGTVSLVGGVVQYTPAANYYGPDSFTYTVSDSNGLTSTAGVNLTVREVNDVPSGANDALPNVFEDSGPWMIPFATLLADDSTGPANESSQKLTIIAVRPGVGGAVSIVGDNVIFAPADNYNGPASFTYTLRDDGQTNGANDFHSSTAVGTFTVIQVNDLGTFGDDTSGSGAEDGGPISGTMTFTDAADGFTTPNFSVSVVALHGTASIEATTGLWSYTPDLNYNGGDSFTVSVTDDDGNVETQVISITVTQVNDSGTFGGDTSGAGNEDAGPITGTLTFADAADGASSPTFMVAVDAMHGVASIGTDSGDWSYTPNLNYNGSDSFTVSVIDDDGNVETQFVSITVNQVNDSGTFGGDTSGTGNEDAGPITGTLTFADAADGFTKPNFSVIVLAVHGTASIEATTGLWSYTPHLNYNGGDSFTVSVIDDDGNVETQVISITVLSAQTQIANFIAMVLSLGLGSGNTNALVSKLENAMDSFNRGNTTAGVNKIESFKNQVHAFVNSGKLSQSQTNALIAVADTVIKSAGTGSSALRTQFNSSGSDSENAQPITTAALLVSDTLWVALDAGSDNLTAEHRVGLQAAIAELNSKLGPYGVALTEMNNESSDQPDIRITVAAGSPCGGAAEGILGCASGSGDITLISGWNWYTGAASGAIGADQYDFRTILTHELAHAIGLSHSSDSTSVMYEMLATGEVRRNLAAEDLVLLEEEAAGPEALLAVPLSGGDHSTFPAKMIAAPVDSGNGVENTHTGTSSYTVFDVNDAALTAILADWIAGCTHSQRASNLAHGTAAGLDISKIKDRSYKNNYLLGNKGGPQTVFNDNETDTSSRNDWFLAKKASEKPSNAAAIDAIIEKVSGEFFTDTDF